MFQTRKHLNRSSKSFGNIESLETRKMMFAADATAGLDVEPVDLQDDQKMADFRQSEGDDVEVRHLYDFGDAPDNPYPTLQAHGGAYHRVSGVYLGTSVDAEADGQPTRRARGDDRTEVDDEDGIRLLSAWSPGCRAEIAVTVSSHGYLNAFVDFQQDGEWGTADQIFSGLELSPGTHLLSFDIPDDAQLTPNVPTFARFRFSSTHQFLGPTNEGIDPASVPDGEVEDHPVWITESLHRLPPPPHEEIPGDHDSSSDFKDSPGHDQQWIAQLPEVHEARQFSWELTNVMVSSYSEALPASDSDTDSDAASSVDELSILPLAVDRVFGAAN